MVEDFERRQYDHCRSSPAFNCLARAITPHEAQDSPLRKEVAISGTSTDPGAHTIERGDQPSKITETRHDGQHLHRLARSPGRRTGHTAPLWETSWRIP